MWIYTVMDLVAKGRTGSILAAPNDGPVIRMFHDALGDEKSPWAAHPQDYTLLRLAEIDDVGNITAAEVVTVATGAQWVEGTKAALASAPSNSL